MARALWKGAIVFGLVNIPVDLYSGAHSGTLDLDWIDKPRHVAGRLPAHRQVDRQAGEERGDRQGLRVPEGPLLILAEEDFKQAIQATQTVDIKAFVPAGAIAAQFFETPYRLAPASAARRATRCCATLRESKKIASPRW